MTNAQLAARRDATRQMFVVYADSGQTVVTYDRALAVEMAHRTNGTWTRVSR
jgi:hypothetical protein